MNFEELKRKYENVPVEEYPHRASSQALLSVCIQTYQHIDFIKECLDSILMQETSFSFEILLGDDGSTDGTREICLNYAKQYPHKIRLFLHHRKNNIPLGGKPSGRFNFLHNLYSAKGKFIALCEGDDYWTDPLKLQKQVDYLERNLDYTLCFHKADILQKDGHIVGDFLTDIPQGYENIEKLAEKGNYIHTPTVLFRNIIKDYPFEFIHAPFGDYFLYMLLSEKGKIKYLKDNMAVYRRGVGMISKMNELDIIINNIKLYSCLISYFQNEDLVKIFIGRQLKIIADFYIEFNETKLSLQIRNDELKEFTISKLEKKILKIIRIFKSPFSSFKS